ncbi:cytoplasmic exosome component Dom34/Pelota [Acrasis kona]|uniref:Protein pelota homolog n=1 Tax=Acrasis kona TaxID=1008807 RepID=A0AAW2ZQ99_9EUKA
MKIHGRSIEKNGEGYVAVTPEIPEDLWHLYHIITEKDQVKGVAVRKVQKESSTGSITNDRVKFTLTISVEKIDFDPQGGALRLSGKNVIENKFIKQGQHHTLEIEINRKITIVKQEWDMIFLKRLEEAADLAKAADVAAIVLTEGKSHLCLLTNHMTIEKQKIEKSIPKKRYSAESHEKNLNKFFEANMQAILRNIDFNIVKCVILASPGFVKDQLLSYMLKEAAIREIKEITQNKEKFMLVHSNHGHLHAIKEVLADEQVQNRLVDTKAAGEVRSLNDFYQVLNKDSDRAFYGPKHVILANEQGAIDTLLITDELFRSSDILTRKKYVSLVESVQNAGGNVKIFSGLHVSGQQLGQLSGVAAILRFPLPHIDQDPEEDTTEEQSSSESESESDEESGDESDE